MEQPGSSSGSYPESRGFNSRPCNNDIEVPRKCGAPPRRQAKVPRVCALAPPGSQAARAEAVMNRPAGRMARRVYKYPTGPCSPWSRWDREQARAPPVNGGRQGNRTRRATGPALDAGHGMETSVPLRIDLAPMPIGARDFRGLAPNIACDLPVDCIEGWTSKGSGVAR